MRIHALGVLRDRVYEVVPGRELALRLLRGSDEPLRRLVGLSTSSGRTWDALGLDGADFGASVDESSYGRRGVPASSADVSPEKVGRGVVRCGRDAAGMLAESSGAGASRCSRLSEAGERWCCRVGAA